MRIQICSALLLASTIFAATARADEAATVETASPGATAAAGDPNIDRGFVLPTAMTQPAGSITYNNYELLLHGVSYGLTDRMQLSATVLAPIIKDMPFVGFASLKGQVYNGARLHLAAQGSVGGIGGGDHGDGVFMGGLGALASVCLRQDCSSLLSASATYELVGTGSSDNGSGLLYGASLVHRVGTHVKLLAEVASASSISTGETAGGALVSYGVRFFGNSIASDIGFIKPVATDGSSPFLMGLPFASISYRWQ
jgi:hypothetical protein